MSSTNTILRVTGVTKKFGNFSALRDVSFEVKSGEVVGFVGANGAGKTTTISTILGFIRPTSGSVELFGNVVVPQTAHRFHGRVGYAAGDMGLPLRLTGEQYFAFVLRQSKDDHRERLAYLTKRFMPQLDKKIGALSRGNRQKIALIAALMVEPDLIVFDEPTSGLDPVMQEVFLDIVRQEQARGATVFMSSHYLTEVATVCDRVVLMRKGSIIQDVSSKELLSRSGKIVRVSTAAKVEPPKNVGEIEQSEEDGNMILSFVFNGEVGDLQQWIADIKHLHDIEVTEYNLEGAFKSLYDEEQLS